MGNWDDLFAKIDRLPDPIQLKLEEVQERLSGPVDLKELRSIRDEVSSFLKGVNRAEAGELRSVRDSLAELIRTMRADKERDTSAELKSVREEIRALLAKDTSQDVSEMRSIRDEIRSVAVAMRNIQFLPGGKSLEQVGEEAENRVKEIVDRWTGQSWTFQIQRGSNRLISGMTAIGQNGQRVRMSVIRDGDGLIKEVRADR